jgi:hypothetical protein
MKLYFLKQILSIFRAPFSVDSTFNKLYFEVNKAWYMAYYHQPHSNTVKDECKLSIKQSKYQLVKSECLTCLRNISLINLSGGTSNFHLISKR